MKNKYIYLVMTGTVASLDINSGYTQTTIKGMFTNLKAAQKLYNAIKRATDWSAPWGLTEIQKVKHEKLLSYLSGDLVNTDLICQYFQPQRGNNEEAFECK